MMFHKSDGCKIDWKPKKNVTVKEVTKRQRNRKTGKERVTTKLEPQPSFFNFFAPPVVPENSDDAGEEESQAVMMDFIIGEAFKDKLVPHAVYWYTSEAIEMDGLTDDSEDDAEYSGSEQSRDDEDSEGDDSGRKCTPKASRRHKTATLKAAREREEDEDEDEEAGDASKAGEAKPAECQQQ